MRVCIALIPPGKQRHSTGTTIDCDDVFERMVRPAAAAAGLELLRGDPESFNSAEPLLTCEQAIADAGFATPALFYHLGLREAVRPGATIMLSNGRIASGALPGPSRVLSYLVDPGGRLVDALAEELAIMLRHNAAPTPPTVLYELVEGVPGPGMLDHLKTDVIRERLQYSVRLQDRLRTARGQGPDAVRRVDAELGNLAQLEFGVALDLLLSYRAVKAWQEMIAVIERVSPALHGTALVQEQLAFALNRAGRRDEAERVLLSLIERRGPMPETCAILGRVYKDSYEELLKQGDDVAAACMLERGIGAYLAGFEADWRDAYPGINVLTLMELRNPADERRHKIRPVVEYAVERKMAGGPADYWDAATCVELAVLGNDPERASAWLHTALGLVREIWEPETTARNLLLIRAARERRTELSSWIKALEDRLTDYARNSSLKTRVRVSN